MCYFGALLPIDVREQGASLCGICSTMRLFKQQNKVQMDHYSGYWLGHKTGAKGALRIGQMVQMTSQHCADCLLWSRVRGSNVKCLRCGGVCYVELIQRQSLEPMGF